MVGRGGPNEIVSARARARPLRRRPRDRCLSRRSRNRHRQRSAHVRHRRAAAGAVKEGRDRVSAALANTGFTFPLRRVTINLAPADVPKTGSAFDLPIALGILAATEQIAAERLPRIAVLGELGLEGAVRPVRGALPVALAARAAGVDALILPRENLPEAGVVDGLQVLGAGSLAEIADYLEGKAELPGAAVDVARLFAERAQDVSYPGTFEGLSDKIPYLKELGINAVEFMPIFEFDELKDMRIVNGKRLLDYWGYNAVSFFAPNTSYTAGTEYNREGDELKSLIKKLHENGIEVILDVVFNHTAEGDEDGPYISFKGVDNNIYYMLTPNGKVL